MDSKYRILFHINTLEHGGTERVASVLMTQFAEDGHDVILATEWYGENEYPTVPSVRRFHVGLTPEDENRNRLSKIFLRIRKLRDLIRSEKPDIIVALGYHCNMRAIEAAKSTGIPVVISIRNNPEEFYKGVIDRIQIRRLFPRAAGCVYQTLMQREFFKPYLQEGTRIILNPVNPVFFTDSIPEIKEKAVVHHARLAGFKNQLMLCNAFNLVHDRHPDYILRIYGEDSHDGTKEKLEARIRELNAGEYIFLMGGGYSFEKELPKGEVYAYSSDYDGMPNCLLEAMALGMPVISTDCPCGGPATVIKDGVNGLLVPVGDTKAMADGICRLIEDKVLAERLGNEAVKLRGITDADMIYKEWKEYLAGIINKSDHVQQ